MKRLLCAALLLFSCAPLLFAGDAAADLLEQKKYLNDQYVILREALAASASLPEDENKAKIVKALNAGIELATKLSQADFELHKYRAAEERKRGGASLPAPLLQYPR